MVPDARVSGQITAAAALSAALAAAAAATVRAAAAAAVAASVPAAATACQLSQCEGWAAGTGLLLQGSGDRCVVHTVSWSRFCVPACDSVSLLSRWFERVPHALWECTLGCEMCGAVCETPKVHSTLAWSLDMPSTVTTAYAARALYHIRITNHQKTSLKAKATAYRLCEGSLHIRGPLCTWLRPPLLSHCAMTAAAAPLVAEGVPVYRIVMAKVSQ